MDFEAVERRWKQTKENFRGYQGFNCPFSINVEVTISGFNIDNMAAQKAITDSMHVGGKARKAPSESKSNYSQMSVMVKMSERVLRHPPLTLSIAPRAGMVSIILLKIGS